MLRLLTVMIQMLSCEAKFLTTSETEDDVCAVKHVLAPPPRNVLLTVPRFSAVVLCYLFFCVSFDDVSPYVYTDYFSSV